MSYSFSGAIFFTSTQMPAMFFVFNLSVVLKFRLLVANAETFWKQIGGLEELT